MTVSANYIFPKETDSKWMGRNKARMKGEKWMTGCQEAPVPQNLFTGHTKKITRERDVMSQHAFNLMFLIQSPQAALRELFFHLKYSLRMLSKPTEQTTTETAAEWYLQKVL